MHGIILHVPLNKYEYIKQDILVKQRKESLMFSLVDDVDRNITLTIYALIKYIVRILKHKYSQGKSKYKIIIVLQKCPF